MSLGVKIKEFLYRKGMKKYGPEILRSKARGSQEWLAFGLSLLNENDFSTRTTFLKQATTRGFFEKTRAKKKVQEVLFDYLKRGLSDEKRVILTFIEQNIHLFSKEDDRFTAAIFGRQRDPDTVVANQAEAILKKIGFEMDYHKPVR